jgi:hypothetical protein
VKEKFTGKCGQDTEKRIVLAFESHLRVQPSREQKIEALATPELYGQTVTPHSPQALLNARKPMHAPRSK